MQEKCAEANPNRPNERYHLEIGEKGAVPGSQDTSGFCPGQMAKDQTVQRRSHGREASHWRGTLPYQTHLLTRTLVTRGRERQQRLTERQQTKQQNTQIWLRRITSCLSQSRPVEHGTSWHWSLSRSWLEE